MFLALRKFPFEFVLMLGDNLYGHEKPSDFVRKFEEPYKPLLNAGIKFYAALGNHDNPNERFYKNFNMGGKRYYSFKVGNIEFFALDSNYMDPQQLEWLKKQLQASKSDWKIAFFHHPLYSDGKRHGPTPICAPSSSRYSRNLVYVWCRRTPSTFTSASGLRMESTISCWAAQARCASATSARGRKS